MQSMNLDKQLVRVTVTNPLTNEIEARFVRGYRHHFGRERVQRAISWAVSSNFVTLIEPISESDIEKG